jgi:hypothetical protein
MNAAQVQDALNRQSQFTIPAGRHTFERPVFLRSDKRLFSHEDAIVTIATGSDYPAFYIVDSRNVEADFPRIEHGGSATGNSTIVAIYRSQNIDLSGGPLLGGWSSLVAYDSKQLTSRLDTRQCLKGHGSEFVRCSRVSLIGHCAIGHKCDGVRFLQHNIGVEVVGGEFAENGSYTDVSSDKVIGVGLHLGQSEDVFVGGRARMHNNLGNGLVWKSSKPPEELGTPRNLRLADVIVRDNGGNNIEVRWNRETLGTVRPSGLTIRDVVNIGAGGNGLYVDADDVDEVTDCVFAESRSAAVRIMHGKDETAPTWRPIRTRYRANVWDTITSVYALSPTT